MVDYIFNCFLKMCDMLNKNSLGCKKGMAKQSRINSIMTGKKNNFAAKLNQQVRTWADIKLSLAAKFYIYTHYVYL